MDFLSAHDLGFPEIEETGETFMENAAIKAIAGPDTRDAYVLEKIQA